MSEEMTDEEVREHSRTCSCDCYFCRAQLRCCGCTCTPMTTPAGYGFNVLHHPECGAYAE